LDSLCHTCFMNESIEDQKSLREEEQKSRCYTVFLGWTILVKLPKVT